VRRAKEKAVVEREAAVAAADKRVKAVEVRKGGAAGAASATRKPGVSWGEWDGGL
jgi:hypothetical protein